MNCQEPRANSRRSKLYLKLAAVTFLTEEELLFPCISALDCKSAEQVRDFARELMQQNYATARSLCQDVLNDTQELQSGGK